MVRLFLRDGVLTLVFGCWVLPLFGSGDILGIIWEHHAASARRLGTTFYQGDDLFAYTTFAFQIS